MLVHLHISTFCPRHIVLQLEFYANEIFTFRFQLRHIYGQCELLVQTRGHIGIGQYSLFHRLTILKQKPLHGEVRKVIEIVFIEDFYLAFFHIPSCDFHVLINLLHLVILRFRLKVGQHDTIHTEHAVVRHIAVVAAIAKILGSVGLVGIYGLVYPIPNGSTAEEVCALYSLPVVNQITHRISH